MLVVYFHKINKDKNQVVFLELLLLLLLLLQLYLDSKGNRDFLDKINSSSNSRSNNRLEDYLLIFKALVKRKEEDYLDRLHWDSNNSSSHNSKLKEGYLILDKINNNNNLNNNKVDYLASHKLNYPQD